MSISPNACRRQHCAEKRAKSNRGVHHADDLMANQVKLDFSVKFHCKPLFFANGASALLRRNSLLRQHDPGSVALLGWPFKYSRPNWLCTELVRHSVVNFLYINLGKIRMAQLRERHASFADWVKSKILRCQGLRTCREGLGPRYPWSSGQGSPGTPHN